MTEGRKAIVVGAGIGGLTTALALTRRGWHVEVLERAPETGAAGSGISLWPNGIRALDTLGLGERVRAAGRIETAGGFRDRTGRWLSVTNTTALTRRYGPLVAIRRADLFAILADALPHHTVREGVTVTGVADRGDGATVFHSRGHCAADLVVGADGIRSVVRESLWPRARGPRPAGYTAWRMITSTLDFTPVASETWGRGERFGVVPLADGCAYLFATANMPEGARAPGGELAEVRRRFGGWPDPIPAALEAVNPDSVLRHDIYDLPALDTFVRGHVALLGDAAHAMSPNLGQGANQALEDAVTLAAVLDRHPIPSALTDYDHLRRTRTQHIVRLSRHVGTVAQWSSPTATWLRDRAIHLLPSQSMTRGMDRILSWGAPR
ncbi:FAD-dependent oxidoreductase [Nocardia otitidiscaviarum]|uniref:FAD-dependent oxidoreductase n=1 Tax=Nocardia otitidiscaviarum TaxID=1823 RepID=A0A516NFY5_9NOCA|nr:FAD-dependent oxidoreductase [Nocardia otitidiscaviarum]MCP9623159.1 FAD-dependent oxidoreductase [Nocardia otitidiscaviarum]QDP77813.1 FAD-dependent oxidoreductase [Nocardia otitidiscaviarum]